MNLKSFLLSFGILTLASSSAATVVGCSCSASKDNSEQDTNNFISTFDYEAQLSVDERKYDNAYSEITPKFVSDGLSAALREKFKSDEFSVEKIVNSNDTKITLTDEDFQNLQAGQTLQAKFIYNYGKYTNQIATIRFPVISNDQADVIDAIDDTLYSTSVDLNSLYSDLKTKIKGATDPDPAVYDFIKNALPADIQPKFVASQFKLFDVSDTNWKELNDSSFKEYGEMDVRINYGYYTVSNETTNLHLKVIAPNEDAVVSEINNVSDYQVTIPIKSKYDELKFKIDKPFIKEKVTNTSFDESALTINDLMLNGKVITDDDLKEVRVLDAQINYDYGSSKNQNTNLKVDVQKMQLSFELRDFQTRDRKNAIGFLGGNDLHKVGDQVAKYLGVESLEAAGIELVNQTSNSVLVRATNDSAEYQGEVTITWKLKLFEIWGLGVSNATDTDLKNGMKGYFYLDTDGKTVKWFNVYGYLTGKNDSQIHAYKDSYHRLVFKSNGQTKDFTFNGKWYTGDVQNYFNGFTFDTSLPNATMTVGLGGPEPARMKYYDTAGEKWVDGANKTYTFNNLGIVTKIT